MSTPNPATDAAIDVASGYDAHAGRFQSVDATYFWEPVRVCGPCAHLTVVRGRLHNPSARAAAGDHHLAILLEMGIQRFSGPSVDFATFRYAGTVDEALRQHDGA